jgi:hypothetical protein
MKNKIVMTAMTIILMTITNKKMETSNIEKNKAVVRTLIEQVMNNRKTELVKQLVSWPSPILPGKSKTWQQKANW